MLGTGEVPCRVRRFLMGCSGWPGLVALQFGCFTVLVHPHMGYHPDRRVSGYRACPCSPHSTVRHAPRPEHARAASITDRGNSSRPQKVGCFIPGSSFRPPIVSVIRSRPWYGAAGRRCGTFPQGCRFHRLPAPTQAEQGILILHCVLELADGEIGSLVGMSRSAVQRHRTKALNELRKRLEDERRNPE